MTAITSWRTSSFSGADHNACVQVANTIGALRDSKNPDGGVIHADIRTMIEAVKSSRVDR